MPYALSPAPRLETDRLILRGHRPADLDLRTEMTGDAAVMRYVGGVAQDPEENWTRILRYAGHWTLLGYGFFAVEEKAGGAFVGEAGLADFHRGLGEDFDSFPEGGWIFSAAAQGRGYATEAMAAVIDWYEAMFGPRRMVCVIAPENAGSIRVASKLGFRPFAERPYRGEEKILFARAQGG